MKTTNYDLEHLFRKKDADNEPVPGEDPAAARTASSSRNANDVFPAPGATKCPIRTLNPTWRDADAPLFWNVFDVKGLITDSVDRLLDILGTKIQITGQPPIEIAGVSHPIIWSDATRGWMPGTFTRFTLLCLASHVVHHHVSVDQWPSLTDRIWIAPQVSILDSTSHKSAYRKFSALRSGAPFVLYRAATYPTIQPHYDIERMLYGEEV